MWYAVDRRTTPKESAMAREQPDPSGERIVIVRGADDQRAALERLWAQGTVQTSSRMRTPGTPYAEP